jgi:phage shock protein A
MTTRPTTRRRAARSSPASDKDINAGFAALEAQAAARGLSLEAFLQQRLTELYETKPEVYDALAQTLAASGLNLARLTRQMESRLAALEAAAQAENNAHALETVRGMRRNLAEMFDAYSAVALSGGDDDQLPS